MPTDLTITLDDWPGELARVGEALGNAGVNIQGVAGFVVEGRGIIHVLVEDADGARSALSSAGIQVSEEADAAIVPISPDENRPGTLGAMARKVADADVNVRAVYLAMGSRGVLVSTDNARALSALQ